MSEVELALEVVKPECEECAEWFVERDYWVWNAGSEALSSAYKPVEVPS